MQKIRAFQYCLSICLLFITISCEFLNPPMERPQIGVESQEEAGPTGDITVILPARRFHGESLNQRPAELRIVYLSDQGQERASLWLGDALVQVFNSRDELIFTTTASSDNYFDTHAKLLGIPYGQNYYVKVSAFNEVVSEQTPVVMGISQPFSVGIAPVEVGVILLPVAPLNLGHNSSVTPSLANYVYDPSIVDTYDYSPLSLGSEVWYRLEIPANGFYEITAQPDNQSLVNIVLFNEAGLDGTFGHSDHRYLTKIGVPAKLAFNASAGDVYYLALESMSIAESQTSVDLLFSDFVDLTEPNDDQLSANPLPIDQGLVIGYRESVLEEDFYSFQGSAGDQLEFCFSSDSSLSFRLYYDDGGSFTLLYHWWQKDHIIYTLEHSGDFYLVVSSNMFGGDFWPDYYSFEVESVFQGSVTSQIDPKPEWIGKTLYLELDENDSILADANAVMSADGVSLILEQINTSTIWSGAGTYTLTAWVDMDGDAVPGAGDEEYECEILVNGQGNKLLFAEDFYVIFGDDPMEPNNSKAAAKAVSMGIISGLNIASGDDDWYSLDVSSGTEYIVSVRSYGYSVGINCLRADGSVLPIQSTDTWFNPIRNNVEYTSLIGFNTQIDERIDLQIRSFSNTAIEYELEIRATEEVVPLLEVYNIPPEFNGNRLYGFIVPVGAGPSDMVAECLSLIHEDSIHIYPKLPRSSEPWSGKGPWELYLHIDVDNSGINSISHGDYYFSRDIFLDQTSNHNANRIDFQNFLESVPQDSLEPNNDISSATPITLDYQQSLTLFTEDSSQEDADYFRFSVEAGEIYLFDVQTSSEWNGYSCELLEINGFFIRNIYVNSDLDNTYLANADKEICLALNPLMYPWQCRYDITIEKAVAGVPDLGFLITDYLSLNDHIEVRVFPKGGDPATDSVAGFSGQIETSHMNDGKVSFTVLDLQTNQPWSGVGLYSVSMEVTPDLGGIPDKSNGFWFVHSYKHLYNGSSIYYSGFYLTFLADSFEPNDTAITASPIGIGDAVSANLHDRDDDDFYRFTVSAPGDHSIQLSAIDEIVVLNVKDSTSASIGSLGVQGGQSSTLNITCPTAGEYVIQLDSSGGATRYEFQLN